MGINEGAFGSASLKLDRNLFGLRCKNPGLLPFAADSGAGVHALVPLVLETVH